MDKVFLIKHNIPTYHHNSLSKISQNIRFKVRANGQHITLTISDKWQDPFGFGFELLRATKKSIVFEHFKMMNWKNNDN